MKKYCTERIRKIFTIAQHNNNSKYYDRAYTAQRQIIMEIKLTRSTENLQNGCRNMYSRFRCTVDGDVLGTCEHDITQQVRRELGQECPMWTVACWCVYARCNSRRGRGRSLLAGGREMKQYVVGRSFWRKTTRERFGRKCSMTRTSVRCIKKKRRGSEKIQIKNKKKQRIK